MYTRPQSRTAKPLRVPENYNGCAFSEIPSPPPPPQIPPLPEPLPPPPQESQDPLPHLQSDEWLLLGMILLLTRNGTDVELILLLTFLLFCG